MLNEANNLQSSVHFEHNFISILKSRMIKIFVIIIISLTDSLLIIFHCIIITIIGQATILL